MARGMANGESIVSQARTPEFDEGYSRTFGDKAVERGRWIWDEARKCLVRAEDYRPPERAVNAPILSGRFYENTKATDGADIGSRAKHQAYMKERGLAPASDYPEHWYAKIKRDRQLEAKKQRRDVIARRVYDLDKP